MDLDVFVFDLDFTLWDAGGTWCDATQPPYFWENDKLLDQQDNWIRLYEDVNAILEELKRHNKKIAAASRTFEPAWAQDLLHHFNIDKFFDLKEIYPANKAKHFRKIQSYFRLPYDQMVFFDDEYRNVEEVGRLGVNTVFVRNGISFSDVKTFL